LQAFAMNCPHRCSHVVPTMPPRRTSAPSPPRFQAATQAVAENEQEHLPDDRIPEVDVDLAEGDDTTEDEDVSDASPSHADPLVAKLWEKLPSKRPGTAGGSSTPTTRPPSAVDGTRHSSYPTSGVGSSRNSSRPMSRLGSARPQPQSPLQYGASASRPSSSPLVGGSRSASAGPTRIDELVALHRPSSSPQIRPQSGRPPKMVRAASAKARVQQSSAAL
jgi:hypothetical protein